MTKSFISNSFFSCAKKNTYDTKKIILDIITASYEYDAASSIVVGRRLTKKINSLNFGMKYIPKVPNNINKIRFAILPKSTR